MPYPPNYGGIIDVFYKIKQLQQLGVSIILHCYQYGRPQAKELEKHCNKVHYYPRDESFNNLFSTKPYIVKSRNSNKLLQNLLLDNHPILFEGLHSTFPLLNSDYISRKTMVRMHNIEHYYYEGLKNSATKISDKLFFHIESKKLKKYETILNKVDHILTISPSEQAYFKDKFLYKSVYIPVFYDNNKKEISNTHKIFSLWHGDLRVVDNQKSLNFIIEIYKGLNTELIIASSHMTKTIIKKTQNISNISIVQIKEKTELDNLIREAHIHPLFSYQKTGIKLRLLNILTNGKHLVSNSLIIEDTGLEGCVHIANSVSEFRLKIRKLLAIRFDEKQSTKRKEFLRSFDPKQSALKIINLLKDTAPLK